MYFGLHVTVRIYTSLHSYVLSQFIFLFLHLHKFVLALLLLGSYEPERYIPLHFTRQLNGNNLAI
jgi:hypothetical protein